jgi:hypothetical protein
VVEGALDEGLVSWPTLAACSALLEGASRYSLARSRMAYSATALHSDSGSSTESWRLLMVLAVSFSRVVGSIFGSRSQVSSRTRVGAMLASTPRTLMLLS